MSEDTHSHGVASNQRTVASDRPAVSIGELLDLAPLDSTRVWRADEMGTILRHQMAACVKSDLESMANLMEAVQALKGCDVFLRSNFEHLLLHPDPPVELLKLTQRFAKANKMSPQGPLHTQIASVVYFAAIVAARLKCGTRISRLDDATLARGILQELARPWLDAQIRRLLEDGLEFLGEGKDSR